MPLTEEFKTNDRMLFSKEQHAEIPKNIRERKKTLFLQHGPQNFKTLNLFWYIYDALHHQEREIVELMKEINNKVTTPNAPKFTVRTLQKISGFVANILKDLHLEIDQDQQLLETQNIEQEKWREHRKETKREKIEISNQKEILPHIKQEYMESTIFPQSLETKERNWDIYVESMVKNEKTGKTSETKTLSQKYNMHPNSIPKITRELDPYFREWLKTIEDSSPSKASPSYSAKPPAPENP